MCPPEQTANAQTATRDIVGVWKLGVRADREGYLGTLEAQRAAAETQTERFTESDMVVLGDFESGTISATFGLGWTLTTDQPAGGNSVAETEIVEVGANGTNYSLAVTGEVGDAVPFAWAGVSYYPSAIPFGPFDLSSKPTLHYWAKGEGGPFRIQLFCDNVGQVPPEQPIAITPEWQEFSFDLGAFDGCNVAGVQAIIFSAGTAPGAFSFHLDEVTLQ